MVKKLVEKRVESCEEHGESCDESSKAVVKVAKKGASVLCNEAVDALASLVTAACKAPMQLVTLALKGVQAVLQAAKKVLRGVMTLIKLALNGLTSLLTLLTRFSLEKVSFSVSASSTIEIKGSVEIVTGRSGADPMVFDFALKVNTKDLPAMALELFRSVFEPLVKQAFDLAKGKIKEALGMNEELERMEAQWELKQMEMLQQKALQDQKIAKAEERVRLAEFRLEEQMRKEAEADFMK